MQVTTTRWAALAVLLAAEAMNVLDATITQVAAPAIHAGLGGARSDIQWFGAAYTLPFAVLLITGGRLGDRYGRRRLFLAGVTGFAIASLCCAVAPDAGVLIAARAVQGAAAALVIPQTIGLIRAAFSGPELAAALGWNGPVVGVSAVTGPVLGAVLTDAASWRVAFLVNVPISVAVLAARRLLPEDRAAAPVRLDLVGTVLAAAGVGLVVHPLITRWHWPVFAAGAAVLAVFAVQQRNRRHPLVERSLFHDRGFPAALVTSTLFFAVMNGLMLVVVLHQQLDEGRDVLTSGLTLLPWSGGLAVSSWVAGTWLVPRFGSRVAFAGLGSLLAGILLAIGWPRGLLGALALGGLGLGLFTVPFFTTALSRVRPQETGSAAGLLNAVQQLGATLGVAVLGSVYLHGHSVAPAFWLAAALVVATAATTALMGSPTASREGPRGEW
ncbi:MFS transporter [Actinophytocola oryzae]|uniref:EmrB/QacA subfamily drug resistance transporter n=1 Tax=Actinophytocola oryzae TaxID=502181 RepID=A0A4R7V105_9PSEU|nr:MFS transporter [Actinophytocola oryzae]TDV42244.1 EmrB/QacA subfamily drug resistance transporter [Actinophytocola oryzae]